MSDLLNVPAPNLSETGMDFGAALQLLRSGRAVARRCWTHGQPSYLYLSNVAGAEHIGVFWRSASALGRAKIWTAAPGDLLATDWRPVAASEMW